VTAFTPGRRAGCVCSVSVDTYTPEQITQRLVVLRQEHRELDVTIERMAANGHDEFEAKRLKRRKLQLKDCIAKLEDMLIPDEPA